MGGNTRGEKNMKTYFYISFVVNGVYCSNIVKAENMPDVVDHYNRYTIIGLRPAEVWEISAAEKKHMPIVEL